MLESLFRQCGNIIFLDVETSGLYADRDEIIELGLVNVYRECGDTYCADSTDMLVRLSEGRKLSQTVTGLTGITREMLEREGVEKSVLRDTLTRLFGQGKPLVVAYNAQFDLCFLYYFLRAHGEGKVMKNIKMLDALTVYKDRRDYPHKLADAVMAYELTAKNTHRAVDDAAATYSLLCAMERERDDLDRYLNLFGYNPKYGVSGPRISSVKYLPQPYTRTARLYENIVSETGK